MGTLRFAHPTAAQFSMLIFRTAKQFAARHEGCFQIIIVAMVRDARKDALLTMRSVLAKQSELQVEASSRGAAVRAASRRMRKMRLRILAARCARVLHETSALKKRGRRKRRVPVAPAARVRSGVAHGSHHRSPEHPAFPARWF